jgi:uncharacterized delta-60 repeat protein
MKTILTTTLAACAVLFTMLASGLAAPGNLEPGFNPRLNAGVSSIALQSDGLILIGGGFTEVRGVTRNHVARLAISGALDPRFNPDVNGTVRSIAVQGDGKILIGGGFTTVGGVTRNRIARLNANGTLDAGFNPNVDEQVTAIVVQADGRILIGGFFTTVGGVTRNRIARIDANGTLDNDFNPDLDGFVQCIAVQENGKILVGGGFSTVGGVARNNLARLNGDASGTLDSNFNRSVDGSVFSIALQADQKILIGGFFYLVGGVARNGIARLNADAAGTLDPAFDPNVNSGVATIAVQADGKILLGGEYFSSVGGVTRNCIARVNANGTLDTGFGPNVISSLASLALQKNGGVLIGGNFSTVGGVARVGIARLDNGAATQSLSAASASRVQWLRGGASPEAVRVNFEWSTNGGSSWSPLGAGTRITGGWELTGLSLPASGDLRARARTTGGYCNGSTGLVETVVAIGGGVPPTSGLSALTFSGGPLNPPFASDTTTYTGSVPNATTSITLTPTVADATATVRVNQVLVASGADSRPLALRVGENVINIVVTAQNRATKRYKLVVIRAKAPTVAVSLANGSALPPVTAPGSVTIRGSAKDDVGVDQVLGSLNGGPLVAATLVRGAKATDPVKWELAFAPENGNNVLVVQTVDVGGNSSVPRTVRFSYTVVRPEVAGTYQGLATATVDSTNPARQVGFCKVTVSRTGIFTGRLTLGGSPRPLIGTATFGNGGDARFWRDGQARPAVTIERRGLPPLLLALHLDVTAPLSQQITGTLTENETVVSTLTLDRQLYTAAAIPEGSPLRHVPETLLNPFTDKGAYTLIFHAIAPPNEGLSASNYPQGDGWALAKVRPSGAVTLAGKLADGQPISFSSNLSQDNVLPLYLAPYAGTGTVSGPVTFRDIESQSDADGEGLRWFKPAKSRDSIYPSGWPNGIRTDLVGSKLVVPARPTRGNLDPLYLLGRDTILGPPEGPVPAGITLTLADGDTSGISKGGAVDARNRIIFSGPADPWNLTATLANTDIAGRLTGKLTGSFKHPVSRATVPFSGVVYQKTHAAGGYFLYFPLRQAGEPAPSGVSGGVGIIATAP